MTAATPDGTPLTPSTPETTISAVTGDDERAVVALWEAAGLTRPWNDPSADLRAALSTPTSTVLGARTPEGALVGTVMVGYDGHRGWVYYLAVDESSRGSGLGRALMVAAEAWLVAEGAPKVQLMVRESNTAVLGFYAALGYTDQACVVLGRRTD